MAITSITRDWGPVPQIVRIETTDTLATVAGAGYLTDQADEIALVNNGAFEWLESDMIAVSASDGHQFFEFDGDDFTTLIQLPGGNGEVTLPVVDEDFVVFDGTLGALKDAGFSASDATKTKVVMAGSAVAVNAIAKFVDTAGTVDDTAGTATNAGSIQAGASGVSGTFISYPSNPTNGTFIVGATNAGGAFNTTLTNTTMGQSTIYTIPDVGSATGRILSAATATPFTTGHFPISSGTGGVMVDSGFTNLSVLRYTTVAITAAEFNGMYADPKLLIAAPGANQLLVLQQVQLLMTYVSANYAAGGVAAVQYDSTANGAGVIASTTLSAATFQAAASTGFVFNAGVVPETFTTCVNKGFYLSNITGAFTTGDSTFVAHIWYRIIPTV